MDDKHQSTSDISRRCFCGRSGTALLLAATGLPLASLSGCGGGGSYGGDMTPAPGSTGTSNAYALSVLVTDTPQSAYSMSGSYSDAKLVNCWGIAFNPQGFVWVANEATATSTLYDGMGVPQSLVVTTPPKPIGIVFNGSTSDFRLGSGGTSGPSPFLFATEDGLLAAWAPSVNATVALPVYDGSAAGKSYTGLALASAGGAALLYAADFAHGAIDAFDAGFNPLAGSRFVDPGLPAGYAPFNVQTLGDRVYVAYAKRDAGGDEVKGAGLGRVNVFDSAGTLIRQLVAGGALNAPWGLALAPAGFGAFANALLVGNFGDGKINAFDASTGAMLGALAKSDGSAIAIDGLWGLAFGNGINSQPATTLFFTAGPADETHGVYGRIDAR
ncbi:TIGR03118 family protein [Roseateles violae]|uniref:TIGR03118 family protein n=1 Tax=Roseateles violae TaxID=3058042 RepID=A0ABT8DN92_9BURK|nr:TIGR03118 family protein [Pelomonas sp. PFR6]MDN3919856.1 TIGR03118 family protein [Pelomonas sp. PFR6]